MIPVHAEIFPSIIESIPLKIPIMPAFVSNSHSVTMSGITSTLHAAAVKSPVTEMSHFFPFIKDFLTIH